VIKGVTQYLLEVFDGFRFDVDAAGNVTTQNSGAAVGGLRTLAFNTTTVRVNPGSFLSQYHLYNGTPSVTGEHDFVLVPGVTGYAVELGGDQVAFVFDVDADGNVTQNSGAAVGTGNTLTFNTTTVRVDPGSYADQYAVYAAPPGLGFVTGPQDLVVVPAVDEYGVQLGGDQSVFSFAVDADGNVTQNTGAAVGSGSTLTFNTTIITIDPGNFTGLYSAVSPAFGSGRRTFAVVPSVGEYLVQVLGASSFTFGIDQTGHPSPTTIPVAVGSDAYTFRILGPQAGSLDLTFGAGGRVTTDFFGGYDTANAVAIQPDGKIVVAGFVDDGYPHVARYKGSGSADDVENFESIRSPALVTSMKGGRGAD
jgi:hypothetical protein